jgi:hypothetical protein
VTITSRDTVRRTFQAALANTGPLEFERAIDAAVDETATRLAMTREAVEEALQPVELPDA